MSVTRSLCALTLTGLFASQAWALPADRTISYKIHETPSDPQTAVDWTVELDLKAASSKGANDIGWEIQEIRITDEGTQAVEWCEVNPYSNPSDNLWWLAHADGNNPTIEIGRAHV